MGRFWFLHTKNSHWNQFYEKKKKKPGIIQHKATLKNKLLYALVLNQIIGEIQIMTKEMEDVLFPTYPFRMHWIYNTSPPWGQKCMEIYW